MSVRLAIAFLLLLPSALYAGPLFLSTSHNPPHSTPDSRGTEDLVLKEAFRRIGYQINIVHLPSKRCLVNANNGIDDGLFARVEGMEAGYPNLVMVPEPVATFEFAVFSKHDIPVNGWNSLKPYRTGIVTGWKILEKNLAQIPSLTLVTNKKSLFAMLESGRLDAAVFDWTEGEALLSKGKPSTIRPIKPLLAKRDMYVYMNKRHAALVGRLSNALKDMKRDGTFQRIVSASR